MSRRKKSRHRASSVIGHKNDEWLVNKDGRVKFVHFNEESESSENLEHGGRFENGAKQIFRSKKYHHLLNISCESEDEVVKLEMIGKTPAEHDDVCIHLDRKLELFALRCLNNVKFWKNDGHRYRKDLLCPSETSSDKIIVWRDKSKPKHKHIRFKKQKSCYSVCDPFLTFLKNLCSFCYVSEVSNRYKRKKKYKYTWNSGQKPYKSILKDTSTSSRGSTYADQKTNGRLKEEVYCVKTSDSSLALYKKAPESDSIILLGVVKSGGIGEVLKRKEKIAKGTFA